MGMGMGMWVLAWVFLVLVVLGVAALVAALLLGRGGQQPPVAPLRGRAREILDERFARGEIDATEYRERLRELDQAS